MALLCHCKHHNWRPFPLYKAFAPCVSSLGRSLRLFADRNRFLFSLYSFSFFLFLLSLLAPVLSTQSSSSSAHLSTRLSTNICMAWILIATSTVIVWITWTAVTLFANSRIARQVGLPVIISLVGEFDSLWILANRCLPIISSLK